MTLAWAHDISNTSFDYRDHVWCFLISPKAGTKNVHGQMDILTCIWEGIVSLKVYIYIQFQVKHIFIKRTVRPQPGLKLFNPLYSMFFTDKWLSFIWIPLVMKGFKISPNSIFALGCYISRYYYNYKKKEEPELILGQVLLYATCYNAELIYCSEHTRTRRLLTSNDMI